jgi:hypothetical protein
LLAGVYAEADSQLYSFVEAGMSEALYQVNRLYGAVEATLAKAFGSFCVLLPSMRHLRLPL